MYAPTSAANVTVTVEGQQIHATFALSLVQNVTTLPNVATTIYSTSDSNVAAAFEQALRNTYPSASPSNLSIGLATTQRGLNLTCNLDILGVSQRNGDILSVNMTWLPFVVHQDLQAQNFSFNTIGSRYLRPVVTDYANASRFVGLPNATITGVTFFVNGTSIGPPAAQDYVGNFTTLNFGSLTPNLGQWNRTYTLSNNTTTWRYFPSKLLNFDMRIQRKNATTDYVATYGYNATISVPGVGRAQGRVLLVGVGTGQTEWVMAAIVILAFVSTIAVQLRYRSRRRVVKLQRK
jgi:hypothetical protein